MLAVAMTSGAGNFGHSKDHNYGMAPTARRAAFINVLAGDRRANPCHIDPTIRREPGHGSWVSPLAAAQAGTAVTGVVDMPRLAGNALAPVRHFVRATTTPAKLRLLLIGLISLCLVWGGIAAWIVSVRASAANAVVNSSETLSFDAQQTYRALSDADANAANAFLVGGLQPIDGPRRYRADIAKAAAHLESATAAAGHSAAAADLARLTAGLPVYTGEMQTARADQRLGLPVGAAYLREASKLMRDTLLPAARNVSAVADAQLAAASGQATGLPLLLVLLAAAVIVCTVLYGAQLWLFKHAHRVFNPGLAVAFVAGLVSLLWLAIALTVARTDLQQAHDQGSAPVMALARAETAALQARADESLTLIDAAGNVPPDIFQTDFLAVQRRLGPGPGTLLATAVAAARGSPGAAATRSAATRAIAWYTAHGRVRFLDDNGRHTEAIQLATAPGPGHSSTLFGSLDGSLTSAIAADQPAFRASAVAGRDAFTALEVGVIVLSLIMAAGCGYGLTRRLAEYR